MLLGRALPAMLARSVKNSEHLTGMLREEIEGEGGERRQTESGGICDERERKSRKSEIRL